MIDRDQPISAEGMVALLALLARSRGVRVSSATIDGQLVWIKRYDGFTLSFWKRLHTLLSPLIPYAFLRSSTLFDGRKAVEREVRKIDAFHQAGFVVPTIVYRNESVLVTRHVADSVQTRLARLRKTSPQEHDDLLVETAAALGRVHGAGLCHGRPHIRDIFVMDGRCGFIDFEEEPEAIMPLAAAQARDLWLLFMPLCRQALVPQTRERAFAAYRAAAPAETLKELRELMRFFGLLVAPLRLLSHAYLGNDGRRLLASTEFLQSALASSAVVG